MGPFAVLQAWLSLLDMGMMPTLSREMARFTGGGHGAASIRDLLRGDRADFPVRRASPDAGMARWVFPRWRWRDDGCEMTWFPLLVWRRDSNRIAMEDAARS